MNRNSRPIIIILLFALLVLLITVGMIKKNQNIYVTPTAAVEQINSVQENIQKTPVKHNKKSAFRSNAEIKEKYGKLETVFLWNGKKYTGAVISTDPVYSILTVDGTINIPIKDVKIREIIR